MNSENFGMSEPEPVYRVLFENFADGICLIDCDRHTIVDINPAFQWLLGYESTDLLHQNFCQIIAAPTDQTAEHFQQVYRRTHYNLGEMKLRCKNGTLITVEVRSSLLDDQPRPTICLILRTVDESTRLKESFLNTMSHELRTPISTMKLAIQMLTVALSREGVFIADPDHPTSNKIAYYLQILSDECDREIGLISDLLDLQKLEAGAQINAIQPVDLQSHLLRIVRPFEEQAILKQQSLQVDIITDLPIVLSDAQSLERMLVELLTNACKYSPPDAKITVMAHDVPATETTPPSIMINVINSGVEISPNQLGRIFDKFYRIPSQDPHKYGGTGLGLALVKKLALNMGGNVRAESGAGQTCFTIEIPMNVLPAIAKLPASVPAPVG
jgi:PAS domain S-box-containing protein